MDSEDYPDWSTLSLCIDCAKHPTLKAYIRDNAGTADRCGACLRRAPEVIVCDLAKRTPLAYVLRALIRLYYNEDDYNGHLGGDDAQHLLAVDNPILALGAEALAREPEILDFIGDLAAELPAPEYDEGIWIFHLNDGWPVFAISRSESPKLRDVRLRLHKENYFTVEPMVREQLERTGARIDTTLATGSRYYRARIGIADEIVVGDLNQRRVFPRPHRGAALGAPPASIASMGRLNRAGVSFLYLASDVETAACEVRPHPSHLLSVGAFDSIRALKIANFTVDIGQFTASDLDLDAFHFIHSADAAMSMPVVPGATARYMVTQLIADVLRQLSYDGVRFASSLGSGQNLCLFDPESFAPVAGSEAVLQVTRLEYNLDPVELRLEAGKDDWVRPA